MSDPANCGACGMACASGEVCADGTCMKSQVTLGCSSGQTLCGASCVDLKTDAANCGKCGTVCTSPTVCTGGNCIDPCAPQTTCEVAGVSTCIALSTDSSNCGTCGHACPAFQHCEVGACVCPADKPNACPASGTPTGCFDFQTSNANCGSCGNACTSPATCVSGVCTCPNGTMMCGTTCVNTQTDPNHCGDCNMICGGGTPFCVNGSCAANGIAVLTISDSPSYNFGMVDTNTSVSHTFTVSNTGSAAASSITASMLTAPFSYNGAAFPGGGTCGAMLNANASCTYNVQFSPTLAVSSSATVTITYSDGANTQMVSRMVLGAGHVAAEP